MIEEGAAYESRTGNVEVLPPADIGPGARELHAEDEAAKLIVDSDLTAGERAARDEVRLRDATRLPVLHAAAIAGMRTNVDAAPVEGGGNDRLCLERQIGRDRRLHRQYCAKYRCKCGCGEPGSGF